MMNEEREEGRGEEREGREGGRELGRYLLLRLVIHLLLADLIHLHNNLFAVTVLKAVAHTEKFDALGGGH